MQPLAQSSHIDSFPSVLDAGETWDLVTRKASSADITTYMIYRSLLVDDLVDCFVSITFIFQPIWDDVENRQTFFNQQSKPPTCDD